MGIKCDKDLVAAYQNNNFTKIVIVYIVYNLDARPRNPTYNLKFKNWFFGATSDK